MHGARKTKRSSDSERTKTEILDVATVVFAEHGYSGASVDLLAQKMKVSKRMIYYYYENKEGLYKAVLLRYYITLRSNEALLHLSDRSPLEALKDLAIYTFDYHTAHADYVRLIMVENIHKGQHIAQMPEIQPMNSRVIETVSDICKRGIAAGVIRKDINPMEIYLTIAGISFFNVSNRYTVEKIFGYDATAPANYEARKQCLIDMILRYVAV